MRLNIIAVGTTDDGELAARAKANSAERVTRREMRGRKLAVVGGGPSLAGSIDVLRAWDGDIWAVNYTGRWLKERGIDSILYTVDSMPLSNIPSKRALLASTAHHETIAQAEQVEFFDLAEVSDDGVGGGSTSVTRSPLLALYLGYSDVTYFGCDGSFDGDKTHVDRKEVCGEQAIVRACGSDYVTNPQMLLQCQELASVITAFPWVFKCASGGLLRAMLEDDAWRIVAVSAELKDHLERNGMVGMFDREYVRQ